MAGSEAAPWRTVEYALQRIRAGRPGAAGLGPEHHTTLHLRAGTHYLSSMISLSGRDREQTKTSMDCVQTMNPYNCIVLQKVWMLEYVLPVS